MLLTVSEDEFYEYVIDDSDDEDGADYWSIELNFIALIKINFSN